MSPMPPLQLGSAGWPVIPGALAAQGSAGAGVVVVAPAAMEGTAVTVEAEALGFCLPVILMRRGGGAAFPGAATGSGAQLLLLLGSAELVLFPSLGKQTGSNLGRAFAARAGLGAPGCTPLFSPVVWRQGSSPRQLCT